MVHSIKKNKHKSSDREIRFFLFKNKINRNVLFNNNCDYVFNDNDQYDINKLFGFSFGFHHKNSARFGWRWDVEKKNMEILAYVYRNSKRVKEWEENIHICNIGMLESSKMEIKVEKGYYIFSVKKTNIESNIEYSLKIKHGRKCFWGYFLNPYFGGNKKAPHDMTIMLN